MQRIIDGIIVYRIIRMLITPWDRQEAFKLGIVDNKGKPLKKASELTTEKERQNYTILHRMVFRFKRIIEKVPMENKQFLSFAAAIAMLKEDKLEELDNHLALLEETDTDLLLEEFKALMEDGAPVNVVGDYSPPDAGAMEKVDKPLKKKLARRKKKDEISVDK
jgi:hypothetical protein